MRRLKNEVLQVLIDDAFDTRLPALLQIPGRRIVNPLFAFLLHPKPMVRWRAVVAMGAVVSQLADTALESARVVIRRMMWQLNDESGGIGWGCPEALGECVARHASIADAYHRILVSYLDPCRNYLEHPMLQQGLLWGVGRAVHSRPGQLAGWGHLLLPHLDAEDPQRRGLAAWAAGAAGDTALLPTLRRLSDDDQLFEFFDGSRLTRLPVKEMATAAAARLESSVVPNS
ncbi:MAG: DVU0298 family protein [Pseudomonadota bacterium]